MKTNINDSKSIFSFSDPVLKESHFVANKDYNPDSKEENRPLSLLGATTNPKKEENGYTSAISSLTVTNLDKNGKFDKQIYPYLIVVTFATSFKWPNNVDQSDVDTFLKLNAPSLILSYMRPYISNLTGASEFDKFDIPFIDFTTPIS